MGAKNFDYDQRCIVIEDDDFENGNYPNWSKKQFMDSRNYPKYELEESEELLELITIFVSYGYYDHACLSYTDDENKYERYLQDHEYTLKGNKRTDVAIDKDYKKQLKKEIKLANKILDRIKKEYGFNEYGCVGIASNGEAFYKEVR